MGRIKKKGTAGNAKNFITRSQAVRKLQISLGDFRRLCIFKGIYPREPRSKKRASKSSTPSTTFYYTKDIQYLLHEPLIAKFRDQKALAKKISKALGRNEVSDAARFEKNLTPKVRLDHIIKERYPTFVDALRDLDDALSMLFLFASLPSTAEVPGKVIAKCQRLTMEFEHYLIRTHSLRKSFLSIKGIYYQATLQGQDILWLVPYRFVQRTSGDVDFRIMATFIDFYTTLLGFVNFRLYTSIGLVYPPKFDATSEDQGAELAAFQLESHGTENQEAETPMVMDSQANEKAQSVADRLGASPDDEQAESGDNEAAGAGDELVPSEQPADGLDQFAPIDETADVLLQPLSTADSSVAAKLFEPFTFFLSRETPRHPIEFILKAFGCKRVGWDSITGDPGSFCLADDKRITHQIVDRPDLPQSSPEDQVDEDGEPIVQSNVRVPGRIYVQPQWVWDSVNLGQLQRADLYAPGATLPPHLSPWVKPRQGEYDPTVPLAEQETAAEAEAAEDEEEEEGEEEEEEDADDGNIKANGANIGKVQGAKSLKKPNGASAEEDDGGMTVELAASDDDEDEESELDGAANDDWDGLSADEDEIDESAQEALKHQTELEAEAQNQRVGAPESKADAKKKAKELAQAKRTRAEREADEDVERRKMMMSRRKRKMYEKMVYSNARKDEEAEKLRSKRRKIERELAKQKG